MNSNNKHLTRSVLIFFIVCGLWYPSNGIAQRGVKTWVVDTEGMGVVVNNDMALARDNAVTDASGKAIEQAVGMFVSSEMMVENYPIINDGIYSRARSYIQNYKIISENPCEDFYMVKVRTTVSMGGIKKDLQSLGLLTAGEEMPRIVVLIERRDVGQQCPDYRWGLICENIIVSKLLEEGFTFVDRGVPADKSGTEKPYSDEYAVSLGKKAGAELVIAGEVITRYSGNVPGTDMKSFQADIAARVIKTDNGTVMASVSVYGKAVHMDDLTGGSEAIKKATEQLTNLLKSQIIVKYREEISSTTMVAMTVRGIKSCSDFVRFRDALKTEISGIKNISPRGMESGIVRFDLNIRGSVQSLVDELAVRSFRGFSLYITDVGQNSVELSLSE